MTDAPPIPLGRRALDTLRGRILAGTLAPGDRLVEEKLSAELGMSRVPIREAIKQLVAEGLAEPAEAGGRGARVAGLGAEAARDLIEVRAVLEGLNARLAARRLGGARAATIRDLLARGEALAAAGDAASLAGLNAAYHALLAEAGDNNLLREMMRPLRERTELVFRRNSPERALADWREHAQVLEAIAEGDEELAALLADRHVRRAARIG